MSQAQSQFFEQAPLIRKAKKGESERYIQRRIEEYLTNRGIVWSRTCEQHLCYVITTSGKLKIKTLQ